MNYGEYGRNLFEMNQDEQGGSRSYDQSSAGVNEEDNRLYEESEEKRENEDIRVAIHIALILVFIIIILVMATFIEVIPRALHVEGQVLEYEVSFQEGEDFSDAMIWVLQKYNNGQVTNEKLDFYINRYNTIMSGLILNQEPSEELLNGYNDIIKDIFGDEAKYLLEVKEGRDTQGFKDGITFRTYDYMIQAAFETEEISEEEYLKYENYKNRVLDDISHKEVEKLLLYMSSLVDLNSVDETL